QGARSSQRVAERRRTAPTVRNSVSETRWDGRPRDRRGQGSHLVETDGRRPAFGPANPNARATDREDKAVPPSLQRDRYFCRRTWPGLRETPPAMRLASWRGRYPQAG